MPVVSTVRLFELVCSVLAGNGVRANEAMQLAQLLVDADLAGHASHGVSKLPSYTKAIRAEHIDVSATSEIVVDSESIVVLDARWGVGPVAAFELTDLLMARASANGIASGTIRNCSDLGRLGPYVSRAARGDLIALMLANDAGWHPQVAPWGGVEPLFGTNPIAFACPVPGKDPICIDMATSITAAGKLIMSARRDEEVSDGLLVDSAGDPVNDAALLFATPKQASILPLGAPLAGHKGFALSLMVDILAGSLSGAGTSRRGDRPTQGVFMHVIRPDIFADGFGEDVDRLVNAITDSRRREGSAPRIPGWSTGVGESEVSIDDEVWNELLEEYQLIHDRLERDC